MGMRTGKDGRGWRGNLPVLESGASLFPEQAAEGWRRAGGLARKPAGLLSLLSRPQP